MQTMYALCKVKDEEELEELLNEVISINHQIEELLVMRNPFSRIERQQKP
jgi:hypothetical protein